MATIFFRVLWSGTKCWVYVYYGVAQFFGFTYSIERQYFSGIFMYYGVAQTGDFT